MALFVTGDTHGALKYTSLAKLNADGYIRRLSPSSFPEQNDLSKSDYVIICGDFGGVFSASTKTTRELPDDKNDLDWLENRPFTTLFVPGCIVRCPKRRRKSSAPDIRGKNGTVGMSGRFGLLS